MNGAGPAIATRAITKRYGDVTAVDGVDLCVNPGEIYALLGLNGAGKTTLIRLLLGMVRPTGGSASILGRHIRPAAGDLWASVGYLVETPSAYPELTVEENLRLAWRLRGLTDPDRVSTVIEELGLTPYRRRRARDLSLGNWQRLGLAKALLHRPRVLLLDEPSNGLDPAGVVEIRDLLHELTQGDGVTILLSSHILTEVARLAHQIGIIHRGRLIDEVDANELPARLTRSLLVSTRRNHDAVAVLRSAGYQPRGVGTDTFVLVEPDAVDRPDEIATLLVGAGCPPTRLQVETEELEEYFLRRVGVDRIAP